MKCLTIEELAELAQALHSSDAPTQLGAVNVLETSKRASAVLVGLQEKEREPHLVLTRRTDHLKHHPGQICFPGGRFEPERDNDLAETVHREVEEELGIAAQQIELWSRLPDIDTMTGFTITPLFGLLRTEQYQPCDEEVAEVLEVPLSFFFDPKNTQRKTLTYQGKQHAYWAYQYQEHFIWGATAKIIQGLVESLNRSLIR